MIKITKQNKLTVYAVAGCALIAVIFILMHATYDWRVRRSLKHECGAGMDCVCFANVIDNRLSKGQVRAFRAFLDSVKVRQTTNILEYTDEVSARGISEAISLCRPAPVQQPAAANQAKAKGKK